MSEGTRGDPNSHRTKCQNVTKRENGVEWLGGFQLRGVRSNQKTRPAKPKPVRGSHDNPRWEHPGKDREEGRSQQYLNKYNCPEEWTSLQHSASNARYRYCGGRATPNLKEEQPDGKSHSSSPSIDLSVTKTPKEKEKGKNGRQAPEPPLQLATRLEGDEAEDGYRAGITTQRRSPAQNPEPKTPSIPTKPKFSRKTRLAKVVMNRSGSGRCTPWTWQRQKLDRARARETKALESGRTYLLKRRPILTRNLHEWKLPFQPGGNKPTLRKQDSASRDLGSRFKKNGTFFNLNAFRRVKAVTTGGTENSLKKEERHDRYDSAYDQARKEPVPSHNLQENSQARFFQLYKTTARRKQPVKRQSVLQQAPRGRGKRRPAQARWNPTQRKV